MSNWFDCLLNYFIINQYVLLRPSAASLFYNGYIFKDSNGPEISLMQNKKKTRIPRNAVSRLPALFHKIEVNL